MAEMVIVRSKIKELAPEKDGGGKMSVSSDFAEALNNEAVELIKKAATRAKANGRSTIQARDL